jgi:serine phosphatase RsbU (regulator of sigma subunit)
VNLDQEFNKAIITNLRLKSKMLMVIFAAILFVQLFLLIYFASCTDFFGKVIPYKAMIIGPLFLLSVVFSEFFFFKRLGNFQTAGTSIPTWLPYLVVLVETSFPTFFILFAGQLIRDHHVLTTQQLITSPPLIMYFIMIILSSLMLEFKLSVFAGFVSGVEYFLVVLFLFSSEGNMNKIELMNVFVRSLLILVCGILAGFISKKTKDAVLSSMESKNILIHKLDALVTEKTAEVTKQKDEIQEKNKEITDSINYAKRLQEAILPPIKLFSEYFSDSFIFYLPKDIVAGDFYWLEVGSEKFQDTNNSELQTRNSELIFFAVADCTGHGVPGALVSVVCSNAMNRAVKEFKLSEPGKILDKVRELVLETFSKNAQDVQDGMDISIACFDHVKKELKWSGANNPCWIIRNGKLIELEHDRQPVGKVDHAKPFTTHSLILEERDMIYLVSDGFADQFGGEKGKKFKTANLKKLLVSVSHKNCEDQNKEISNTFSTWKGQLEQVDDVCIMGIKI